MVKFFFSSRRRHTRCGRDWSSDVCSSDLFLTTYSGKSVNNKSISPIRSIPLPNWQISYNGLTKFDFFKKFVQNFTLRHGYTSSVTVGGMQDRKSTRLNSSHVRISYAVFCLKKKR